MIVVLEGSLFEKVMSKLYKIMDENKQIHEVNSWGIEREINTPSFKAKIDLSPHNQRITFKDYSLIDENGALEFSQILDELANKNNYGKVWLKASKEDAEIFTKLGFVNEAVIKAYFKNNMDALICSRLYG